MFWSVKIAGLQIRLLKAVTPTRNKKKEKTRKLANLAISIIHSLAMRKLISVIFPIFQEN